MNWIDFDQAVGFDRVWIPHGLSRLYGNGAVCSCGWAKMSASGGQGHPIEWYHAAWVAHISQVQQAYIDRSQHSSVDLLRKLYEWSLSAFHQGTGTEFWSPERYHMFISTWEDAEDILPLVREYLRY